MLYTLFFIVITDINVMVAESTEAAQVKDPVESLRAEDSVVWIPAGEPSIVELVAVAVAVTVETTTITVPEVLATTSVSDEPVVDLIPAQVELAPVSVDATRTIIERGPGVH